MKKLLQGQAVKAIVLLLLSVFYFNRSNAQDWITVGNTGIVDTTATDISFVLGPDGTPYLAYNDVMNYNKISVIKYVNNSWQPIDSALNINANPVLAVDHNGILYLACSYTDYAHTTQIMKYEGTTWVNITGSLHLIDQNKQPLAIDNNNNLYTAYKNDSNKVSVVEYDGNNWVAVGDSNFSNTVNSPLSLAIDNNNEVYVAYNNYSVGNRAYVMKYDGNNWGIVGGQLDKIDVPDVPMAIDNNGTPYIVYSIVDSTGIDGLGIMMKYDGTNWVKVGGESFAAPTIGYCAIAIDGNGNPYVAYRDMTNNSKIIIREYNGSSWVTLGNPHIYKTWYPC
ncbi:MAG TPA: hypothetical protein VHA52_12660, partial [Candidatus Babeliaceae bacterium]|nr:hypothetical protein [Candidatus Babeliaceae bacterium]